MTRSEYLLLAVLLGSLSTMTSISIDPTLAAMPSMAAYFGVGASAIQISLTAYILGVAFGQLIHGPMSDRFGRKPALLSAVGLYLLSSAGCMVAPNVEALIALRFLQGIAACAGTIVARAIVRDRYEREAAARLISVFMTVHGFAPIVAPIVGGYLTVAFGWQSIWGMMSIYAAAMILLVSFMLKETNQRTDPTALSPARMLRNYSHVLRNRTFWAYMLCAGCAYAALLAFLSGSSTVIISFLGMSPDVFGLIFSGTMAGYVIGMFANTHIVSRIGLDRTLAIGAALCFGSTATMEALALSGVNTVAAIAGPMFVFMAGFSLTVPQGMAGAISPFPQIAGAASSMMGFLQFGASSVLVIAVGLLSDGTQMAMTTAMFAMGCGVLFFYVVLIRPIRQPAAKATG